MKFKGQGGGFREADLRYEELERQRKAGTIDDEQFDAQRRKLMLQDEEGRWWVRSRETGEWLYHDGDAWVQATPPGYDNEAPSPPTRTTPAEPYPRKGRRRVPIWILVVVGILGLGIMAWLLQGFLGVGGAGFEAAFIHRATAENISGDNTYLDHPSTNDNPDALLHVTQNWNPEGKPPNEGVYNAHAVGVWYDPQQKRWAIFNEDREAMPENAAFNVFVMERPRE